MKQAKQSDNLIDALTTVAYFAGVQASTLQALADVALYRSFETDRVVVLEGEPSSGLYVIDEGWLKAVKTSLQGREQVLHILGPGEVFNAIGVFLEGENPATVVALEPTKAWVIERRELLALVERRPDLARALIQNLAGRVQHLVELVEDLSLRTVEARLARMLLEQASDNVVQRERWATQAEMASRLGTVPDVLNRALRDLADATLIEVTRRHIRILDASGLESRAELA